MSVVETWKRRLEPLLRIAFGLLFLLVSWLALTPQPPTLSSGNDKSDHLLAFLTLTLFCVRAGQGASPGEAYWR